MDTCPIARRFIHHSFQKNANSIYTFIHFSASSTGQDSMADLQVREITGTDLVPTTFRLRYEVWSAETKLLPHIQKQGLIADAHEAHARHWAVLDGGELMAAARMCIHEVQEESPDASTFSRIRLSTPVATINRLVVRPSVRNVGLAKQLDECRILAARDSGAKCVAVTAAPTRFDALQRLGFRLAGDWIQPSFCESPAMHGMLLML